MNPEDRVLVGVIKAKRDLEFAINEHWYRIPQGRAPNGIDAEYLAFFLSGSVFKERSGGIHYYARRTGDELARRKDLVRNVKPHPRDDEWYHKVQLAELQPRLPPIWNKPRSMRFAFIYTTWDRFQSAETIRDLYSKADYFVDRVFHVLRQRGIKPRRTWEAVSSGLVYPRGAQIRILADNGAEVIASTQGTPADSGEREAFIYLRPSEYLEDAEVAAHQIIGEVNKRGGPKMVDIPIELY